MATFTVIRTIHNENLAPIDRQRASETNANRRVLGVKRNGYVDKIKEHYADCTVEVFPAYDMLDGSNVQWVTVERDGKFIDYKLILS